MLQLIVYAAITVETMRESWTDDRLDALNERVDERFDRVDEKFDRVDEKFDRVDERFVEVNRRLGGIELELKALRTTFDRKFDHLNRSLLYVLSSSVTISVALVAAALIVN